MNRPLATLCLSASALLASSTVVLAAPKPSASTSGSQQVCLRETDSNSPRHTRLHSTKPDDEIIRIDLDHDGDPDLLERWLNGKRVRWLDENDDMKWTDTMGDQSGDAMQIDRDGDGYYDGPGDLNIKWCDDDGDGRPDVEIFAANPSATQRTVAGGTSVFMVFIDVDHDGVLGYIDWNTFEFNTANWRVPPTTSPTRTIPPPNFSPDYNGNTIFLKQHLPAWCVTNPRMNWENPFAFFDFDDDGLTEMSIRLLDPPPRLANQNGIPTGTYSGFVNEAMSGWDLDNDSSKGNEMDYDMTWKFTSASDGSHGDRIDYRHYSDPHPNMKAPQWVLDGHYFRYDNWRKLTDFCYVTHDKCFDEMWNTNWGECWITFDEDDDDHRWERVELYYPDHDVYSTQRFGKGNSGGISGHPQADSLGDRGEWDRDNSGKGQVYIGKWDAKIHLYGAEKGAWLVDEHAKYWGSWPVLGDSSPQRATKVGEVVQYYDTDNNGFFDKITYDYDGDKKVDLEINLLDYKTTDNPHPDVQPITNPGKVKWQGMHELYCNISRQSFQDALKLYRALWKKGLTTSEMEDLSIASSVGEQYDHGYWLKEKIFRTLDRQLLSNKSQQANLRKAYFTGDYKTVLQIIDALNPVPERR